MCLCNGYYKLLSHHKVAQFHDAVHKDDIKQNINSLLQEVSAGVLDVSGGKMSSRDQTAARQSLPAHKSPTNVARLSPDDNQNVTIALTRPRFMCPLGS